MPNQSNHPESRCVVTFWRGDFLETSHDISLVLADESGGVLNFLGNPDLVTGFRSAAKPFQAIPIITLPNHEALNISPEEIAICCASHPGTPEHTAFAAAALSVSGFNPDDLVCGPAGNPPACLKHGCSGNHAAILIGAKLLGAKLHGYQLPDHPIQIYITNLMKELTGAPEVHIAIDGCGVPSFGVRIREMATAYAALNGAGSKYTKITGAMTSFPHLIGANRGIDVGIIMATQGRLIAKTGAEGLLCIGYPGAGRGVAIKCHDGTFAAIGVVGLRFLIQIGWMTEAEVEHQSLSKWWRNAEEPKSANGYCRVEIQPYQID